MISEPFAIDLQWMNRPGCVCSWRVGDLLIDCGPRTTVETLVESFGSWRPNAVLLTHIHFDHAGAAGELVRRWPDLLVYVHRSGARHLTSPARLESSARRVFGASFDERFGSLLPIPETNVHALDGGETIRGFRAIPTPGHAVHHMAYINEDTGRAFTGDLGAVRLGQDGPLLPATPPPDINIDDWLRSIDTLKEHNPRWIGLPHFGSVLDPVSYLEGTAEAVQRHAETASSFDRAAYIAWAHAQSGTLSVPADDYELVVPLGGNYKGLRRWLDRRRAAA